MTDLAEQQCRDYRDASDQLNEPQITDLLALVHPGWQFNNDQQLITRAFEFGNFLQTMNFANAVAWIAEQQNHHPDLHLSYRRCLISYTTHSVAGLSRNDFICAARIDALTH